MDPPGTSRAAAAMKLARGVPGFPSRAAFARVGVVNPREK